MEWMDDLKKEINAYKAVVIDPIVIGLADDFFMEKFNDFLKYASSIENMQIIIASNLYPFHIERDNILARLKDIKIKPWHDLPKSVIISTVLPHPFFGLFGAPHLTIMGEKNLDNLIINNQVKEYMSEIPEEKLVNTTLFENLNSTFYSINLVPFKDKIIPLGVGEIIDSFQQSMKLYKNFFKVEGQYSMLVTSIGGAPYDSSVLGMIQSLINTNRYVEDGGEIILLSECGMSLKESQWIRELIGLTPTRKTSYIEMIRNKISEITDRISVRIISTLPHNYIRRLGFKTSDTASFAFQLARRRIRENKSYFISWGYHVNPI